MFLESVTLHLSYYVLLGIKFLLACTTVFSGIKCPVSVTLCQHPVGSDFKGRATGYGKLVYIQYTLLAGLTAAVNCNFREHAVGEASA